MATNGGRCGPLCQHPGCWQSAEFLKGLPPSKAYMKYVASIISKHAAHARRESCRDNDAVSLPTLTVQSLDDALPMQDADRRRRTRTVPNRDNRLTQGHTSSHALPKVTFSQMLLQEVGGPNGCTVTPVLVWKPGKRKGKVATNQLCSKTAVKVMNLAEQVCLEEHLPKQKPSVPAKPKILRQRGSGTARPSANSEASSYLQDIPPHVILQLLEHLQSASSASLGNMEWGHDPRMTTALERGHDPCITTAMEQEHDPCMTTAVEQEHDPLMTQEWRHDLLMTTTNSQHQTSLSCPHTTAASADIPLTSPAPCPPQPDQAACTTAGQLSPIRVQSTPPTPSIQLALPTSQSAPPIGIGQPAPPLNPSPTGRPAPFPPASILYDLLSQMLLVPRAHPPAPRGYSRTLAARPQDVLSGHGKLRKPPARGCCVATTTLTLPRHTPPPSQRGRARGPLAANLLPHHPPQQLQYPHGNPVVPRMSPPKQCATKEAVTLSLGISPRGNEGQELETDDMFHISICPPSPKEPKAGDSAPRGADKHCPAPMTPYTVWIPNCSEAVPPKTPVDPEPGAMGPKPRVRAGDSTLQQAEGQKSDVVPVAGTMFSPDHTVVSALMEGDNLLLLDREGKVVHEVPDSIPEIDASGSALPNVQQISSSSDHQQTPNSFVSTMVHEVPDSKSMIDTGSTPSNIQQTLSPSSSSDHQKTPNSSVSTLGHEVPDSKSIIDTGSTPSNIQQCIKN